MKLGAVAIDYDGTIAVDGVFDPAARTAIAELRLHGIAVILVTGRRLDDLEDRGGQPRLLQRDRRRKRRGPLLSGKWTQSRASAMAELPLSRGAAPRSASTSHRRLASSKPTPQQAPAVLDSSGPSSSR